MYYVVGGYSSVILVLNTYLLSMYQDQQSATYLPAIYQIPAISELCLMMQISDTRYSIYYLSSTKYLLPTYQTPIIHLLGTYQLPIIHLVVSLGKVPLKMNFCIQMVPEGSRMFALLSRPIICKSFISQKNLLLNKLF